MPDHPPPSKGRRKRRNEKRRSKASSSSQQQHAIKGSAQRLAMELAIPNAVASQSVPSRSAPLHNPGPSAPPRFIETIVISDSSDDEQETDELPEESRGYAPAVAVRPPPSVVVPHARVAPAFFPSAPPPRDPRRRIAALKLPISVSSSRSSNASASRSASAASSPPSPAPPALPAPSPHSDPDSQPHADESMRGQSRTRDRAPTPFDSLPTADRSLVEDSENEAYLIRWHSDSPSRDLAPDMPLSQLEEGEIAQTLSQRFLPRVDDTPPPAPRPRIGFGIPSKRQIEAQTRAIIGRAHETNSLGKLTKRLVREQLQDHFGVDMDEHKLFINNSVDRQIREVGTAPHEPAPQAEALTIDEELEQLLLLGNGDLREFRYQSSGPLINREPELEPFQQALQLVQSHSLSDEGSQSPRLEADVAQSVPQIDLAAKRLPLRPKPQASSPTKTTRAAPRQAPEALEHVKARQAQSSASTGTSSDQEEGARRYPRRDRPKQDYNLKNVFQSAFLKAQQRRDAEDGTLRPRSVSTRPSKSPKPDADDDLRPSHEPVDAPIMRKTTTIFPTKLVRDPPTSFADYVKTHLATRSIANPQPVELSDQKVQAMLQGPLDITTSWNVTVAQDEDELQKLSFSDRTWLGVEGPNPLTVTPIPFDVSTIDFSELIARSVGSLAEELSRMPTRAELLAQISAVPGLSGVIRNPKAEVVESAKQRFRGGPIAQPLPKALARLQDSRTQEEGRLFDCLRKAKAKVPKSMRDPTDSSDNEEEKAPAEEEADDEAQRTVYDADGEKRRTSFKSALGGEISVRFVQLSTAERPVFWRRDSTPSVVTISDASSRESSMSPGRKLSSSPSPPRTPLNRAASSSLSDVSDTTDSEAEVVLSLVPSPEKGPADSSPLKVNAISLGAMRDRPVSPSPLHVHRTAQSPAAHGPVVRPPSSDNTPPLRITHAPTTAAPVAPAPPKLVAPDPAPPKAVAPAPAAPKKMAPASVPPKAFAPVASAALKPASAAKPPALVDSVVQSSSTNDQAAQAQKRAVLVEQSPKTVDPVVRAPITATAVPPAPLTARPASPSPARTTPLSQSPSKARPVTPSSARAAPVCHPPSEARSGSRSPMMVDSVVSSPLEAILLTDSPVIADIPMLPPSRSRPVSPSPLTAAVARQAQPKPRPVTPSPLTITAVSQPTLSAVAQPSVLGDKAVKPPSTNKRVSAPPSSVASFAESPMLVDPVPTPKASSPIKARAVAQPLVVADKVVPSPSTNNTVSPLPSSVNVPAKSPIISDPASAPKASSPKKAKAVSNPPVVAEKVVQSSSTPKPVTPSPLEANTARPSPTKSILVDMLSALVEKVAEPLTKSKPVTTSPSKPKPVTPSASEASTIRQLAAKSTLVDQQTAIPEKIVQSSSRSNLLTPSPSRLPPVLQPQSKPTLVSPAPAIPTRHLPDITSSVPQPPVAANKVSSPSKRISPLPSRVDSPAQPPMTVDPVPTSRVTSKAKLVAKAPTVADPVVRSPEKANLPSASSAKTVLVAQSPLTVVPSFLPSSVAPVAPPPSMADVIASSAPKDLGDNSVTRAPKPVNSAAQSPSQVIPVADTPAQVTSETQSPTKRKQLWPLFSSSPTKKRKSVSPMPSTSPSKSRPVSASTTSSLSKPASTLVSAPPSQPVAALASSAPKVVPASASSPSRSVPASVSSASQPVSASALKPVTALTSPSQPVPVLVSSPPKSVPASVSSAPQPVPALMSSPSKPIAGLASTSVPAPVSSPSKPIPASASSPSKYVPASVSSAPQPVFALASKPVAAPVSSPSSKPVTATSSRSRAVPASASSPSKSVPASASSPSKSVPASASSASKPVSAPASPLKPLQVSPSPSRSESVAAASTTVNPVASTPPSPIKDVTRKDAVAQPAVEVSTKTEVSSPTKTVAPPALVSNTAARPPLLEKPVSQSSLEARPAIQSPPKARQVSPLQLAATPAIEQPLKASSAAQSPAKVSSAVASPATVAPAVAPPAEGRPAAAPSAEVRPAAVSPAKAKPVTPTPAADTPAADLSLTDSTEDDLPLADVAAPIPMVKAALFGSSPIVVDSKSPSPSSGSGNAVSATPLRTKSKPLRPASASPSPPRVESVSPPSSRSNAVSASPVRVKSKPLRVMSDSASPSPSPPRADRSTASRAEPIADSPVQDLRAAAAVKSVSSPPSRSGKFSRSPIIIDSASPPPSRPSTAANSTPKQSPQGGRRSTRQELEVFFGKDFDVEIRARLSRERGNMPEASDLGPSVRRITPLRRSYVPPKPASPSSPVDDSAESDYRSARSGDSPSPPPFLRRDERHHARQRSSADLRNTSVSRGSSRVRDLGSSQRGSSTLRDVGAREYQRRYNVPPRYTPTAPAATSVSDLFRPSHTAPHVRRDSPSARVRADSRSSDISMRGQKRPRSPSPPPARRRNADTDDEEDPFIQMERDRVRRRHLAELARRASPASRRTSVSRYH